MFLESLTIGMQLQLWTHKSDYRRRLTLASLTWLVKLTKSYKKEILHCSDHGITILRK